MAKKKKQNKGPKSQHFVPAGYLSEFVDVNTPEGQEPYVWIFDRNGRNRRKKAPKNIFTENHLYTIEFKGEKDFSIEQNLSKIEDRFAHVMRIIKKKKPLTPHEHAYLCIFVAAQLQRTLRYKKNQEDFIQQLIDHGTQMALAHGVSDSKQVAEWKEHKKDIHKIQLMESLPFLANIIQQMSISFLCTPDVKNHPFITSDEPCVLFNPDLQWQRFYGPGFAQEKIQLTMPLSPEITVMFSWANYHGYSVLPIGRVEDLNRMARSYAEKEFVSSTPNRKLIWFFKIPLDPIFIFKMIKFKIKLLIYDLNANRMRKNYGKKYRNN